MKNKSYANYFTINSVEKLCRIVFAMILVHLVFSAFGNTLVHQMQMPVLKFVYVDPAFWIMHLLNIPEFISSHYIVAGIFDIILFLSCTAVIIFPRKKWIIAIFIFFYFNYYIIFNSFGAHHTHALIPILIAPIPFLFSKKSFFYLWEGLRYFLLFSYSAAFLWKFFRLSWLQNNQGILIIKKNLTPYLYFNPDSFLSKIFVWFLDYPAFTNAIFISGFIMEGFFIIGFFTKKFDSYVFILSIILPVGFWFFADALFFEQLILSLTLLKIKLEENS
jgi:hypothetical protein